MVISRDLRKRIDNLVSSFSYLRNQAKVQLPETCEEYIIFVEKDKHGWDLDTQEFTLLVHELKRVVEDQLGIVEGEEDVIRGIKGDIIFILEDRKKNPPKQPNRI